MIEVDKKKKAARMLTALNLYLINLSKTEPLLYKGSGPDTFGVVTGTYSRHYG